MTNKQLAKQLRDIGNSLFDRTNDPNFKLLLDEAGDRLENQSKWISVDERLPEKEDDYLVYTTAGFIETDRFSVPEDKDVDGHWFELDDYVTHWMPLPEAPRMKGGEQE